MATRSFRELLHRLKPIDRIALSLILLYGLVWIVQLAGYQPPLAGPIAFFFFLSLSYLVFRLGGWARTRLMWSLRNRLVMAYVFIAVAPLLMLLVMIVLSARILYSQLGGYLLVEDLQKKIEEINDAADTVASAAAMFPADLPKVTARAPNRLPVELEAHLAGLSSGLPELEFDLHADGRLIQEAGAQRAGHFEGLVQTADGVWLVGEVARGRAIVRARAPVTPQLLESVATFLGPIQIITTRPASSSDAPGSVLTLGGSQYRSAERIMTKKRTLSPAKHWYDFQITDGIANIDSLREDSAAHTLTPSPVFAIYSARLTQINAKLFSSLGDLSNTYVELLLFVGLVFLVLEAGALVTGIVLTRTITRSVGDLYEATQFVRIGDFGHRVRVERADQLGALGESFNAMSSSIDSLVEEQKKRQRLENEISIAHEVQSQLFPRNVPVLSGIQLAAFCKPARGVSGDYYDFLPLGSSRLAIALADISGKGISAALLMASVQAALRSHLLLDTNVAPSAAEVVSRINRHLYLNTAEDRFATFFFAIYDSATRLLRYTNAGHVPPMCIHGDRIEQLETGGTVVGVFEDVVYEEGLIEVAPGSTLVVYSDGLVEPENVYGEEFGMGRLQEVAVRHQQSSAESIVSALLVAAEEWAGTAEQADDMTVIVARLGDHAR